MKTAEGFPVTIQFIDRYVPAWLSIHVKILLFILIFEFISILINLHAIISEQTLHEFILMFFLMEAFMWVAYRIFVKGAHLGETRKEITKNLAIRYAFFYLVCFFISFVVFIVFMYVLYWVHGWDLSQVFSNFIHREFKGWFKAVNFGLMVGAFFFVIAIWQEALAQAQKLREERLTFKYETLRNQVNPHFLFNSLNTLSSLVRTNADLAEKFIQKLSSIYRYVLENREVDLIDLTLELDFVKDYFYLQQIRDDDKIEMSVDIREPERYRILPMSVQLLVENALKHNSATREKPLYISIFLEKDAIIVKNNLQNKLTIEPSSKIGLKNLAERVKFTTRKELQVTETAVEFKVSLPLIPKQA